MNRPAPTPAGDLLVALHGFDDDPGALARSVARHLPGGPENRWSVVCPRGPLSGPVGRAWFPGDGAIDDEHVGAARRVVREAIGDWEAGHGAPGRLVIAGYSQGAALAILVALDPERSARRPDGLVIAAGYLPPPDLVDLTGDAGPPEALVIHGAGDEVVAPTQGRAAVRVLERAGSHVHHVEPALGHALVPDLFAPLGSWLADLPHRRADRTR